LLNDKTIQKTSPQPSEQSIWDKQNNIEEQECLRKMDQHITDLDLIRRPLH
jgi:hypothetical protein